MPPADGRRDPDARDTTLGAALGRGATGSGGRRIVPFGDDAILVDLGEPAGIAAARRAQALARAVEALRDMDPRLGAPVPGSTSVLVPFDAGAADTAAIAARLRLLLAELPADAAPTAGARDHAITVRYGGDDGPDLEASAALAGLTPAALVALHASMAYEVLFLGFAPGFAYLGELPDALRLPRLATPRTHVPAGSVAIAGGLTAVYPHASPGGWRVLGHADVRLFDPAAASPALLRPGDRVRFVPG